jgi:hypothetical protein
MIMAVTPGWGRSRGLQVVRHCWGEDVSQVLRGGAVDMVIACEVVYNNDAFSSLIHTLCQLIGTTPQPLRSHRASPSSVLCLVWLG